MVEEISFIILCLSEFAVGGSMLRCVCCVCCVSLVCCGGRYAFARSRVPRFVLTRRMRRYPRSVSGSWIRSKYCSGFRLLCIIIATPALLWFWCVGCRWCGLPFLVLFGGRELK